MKSLIKRLSAPLFVLALSAQAGAAYAACDHCNCDCCDDGACDCCDDDGTCDDNCLC